MASNQATLADDDGDSSDWIELDNRGPQAVNLDGWFLTDRATDLDKWQLPDVTLHARTATAGLRLREGSRGARTCPAHEFQAECRRRVSGAGPCRRDDGRVRVCADVSAADDRCLVRLGADGRRAGLLSRAIARSGQSGRAGQRCRSERLDQRDHVQPAADGHPGCRECRRGVRRAHNRGTQTVDVTDWKFSRGVEFTLPTGQRSRRAVFWSWPPIPWRSRPSTRE